AVAIEAVLIGLLVPLLDPETSTTPVSPDHSATLAMTVCVEGSAMFTAELEPLPLKPTQTELHQCWHDRLTNVHETPPPETELGSESFESPTVRTRALPAVAAEGSVSEREEAVAAEPVCCCTSA